MNTTFFKLAIRNIRKNKLNSTINILGFSLGLAACLFIFLFVKFESSFDSFYPNKDNIYRLVGSFNSKGKSDKAGFTWFPAAPDIKNEVPGVDAFCRVTDAENAKCYVDNSLYSIDDFRFADDNFFDFFHFNLISGDPATVLNSADKIVLTEKTAQTIFGTTDVIGETILFQHKLFTVSGIAANPPQNTHLGFDGIASVKYIEQSDEFWKGWGGGITFLSYLQLSENTSAEQVEQAFPGLLDRKINKAWAGTGFSLSMELQKISDVHLSNGSITEDCSSNRSAKSIYIVATICLLILLLAVVNYIVLYSAQKMARSKDVGILKIHGASQYRLMAQTYAEVLVVSAIASVLSFLLLWGSLPFLNSQLHTSVSIGESLVSAIGFTILAILLLSALVTFFSTYKMLLKKSVDILQDKSKAKGIENNLLVSLQFTIVIVLLVAVSVISKQNKFLLNQELGFNKENVLVVESDEEFANNELASFKQDLKQLANVQSVSLSSQTVGNGLTMNGYMIEGQTESTLLNVVYTDPDFLDCYGIHLLEGKNFSSNSALDKDAILVNHEFVKQAGWKDPLGKTIARNGTLHVVGVVNDFNFSSLEHSVKPLLIMANPAWDGWEYSTINIRYQTSDIRGFVHQVDQLWKNHFPETPFKISFLDDALNRNYESFQSQQKIIVFFSLLAVFIAAIGLFGLTVFTARNRIKEIGIRKVNGAKISEVMVMLNRDFVKWVAIAFVIATPIAWYAMHKWLENFAYKTEMSWWIFALAGVLALGIALLTVSVQSYKAAVKNPVESLRYE